MARMMQTGVSAHVVAVLALSLLLTPTSASTGSRFRGSADGAGRTVAVQRVEASLRSSLEAVLYGGDAGAARRLAAIEASIWPTFQALPKNNMGRLAPRAVRYLVHGYFGKEHGWLIRGLEPHGMQQNVTEVHEVSILQDRAPVLVEALLEARQSGHGLSLGDAVAMVASLERLIFDESLAVLEAAYALNGLSAAGGVDEKDLHKVLQSYLLLFESGVPSDLGDVRRHQELKRKISVASSTWATFVDFEQNAAQNFVFARRDRTNPFLPARYTFAAASKIVEGMAQAYGKWQNTECRQMRGELMELDAAGTGRVPLASFYSQPNSSSYQFTESLEYLREIGALDESAPGSPRVRIANYMMGPSNCIASSSYYSVCCLNDCEHLMNELEGMVKAPTASPEQLLRLLGNVSSPTVDAPRDLPADLQEKVRAIARRHGGVPLHGRLFAQWLHFAFPNECPYPHVIDDVAALTPGHWESKGKGVAPAEERQRHIEAAATEGSEAREAAAAALQWSEDEVLPAQEPRAPGRRLLGGAMRAVSQLATLVAAARMAWAGWKALAFGAGRDKARRDPQLPVHM
mmetsp:Transcript_38766/g.120329  ORF Transcript_38766/g.120329 Transcript_38766/m.120329 type:complete len:575 (-) Transcript_38766:119-1843(-)